MSLVKAELDPYAAEQARVMANLQRGFREILNMHTIAELRALLHCGVQLRSWRRHRLIRP